MVESKEVALGLGRRHHLEAAHPAAEERTCPHCGGPITDSDTVCPHCGETLVGLSATPMLLLAGRQARCYHPASRGPK